MRPLWSGTISFGLINIPVRMLSATEHRALDLDMLRKDDLCPIKYTRVCKSTGEEVPYNDIVKGYEYHDGDYVVLEKEDLKKVSAIKTNTIDIVRFVKSEEIDSKYYEKPYYLEPGKGGDKAYVLLREALASSKKVAVAKFVFKTKEDLAIIKPDGDTLILNQMRYFNEIRDASKLEIPKKVNATRAEISMAVKLVDQLSGKFNPKEFHDRYREELEKLIEQKAHGKKLHKVEKEPEPTSESDLMSQLKESLKHADSHSYS